MMLLKNGVEIEQEITFGQPMIGDKNYAAFATETFKNQIRIVHHKDIYPHTPPNGYAQGPTEIFQDKDGSYRVCDGSGADPTCSDQYAFWQLSQSDHWLYMDTCIGPDCRCDDEATFL